MDTSNITIAQRSLDWHRARLGKFTASEIGKLRGKPRKAGELFTQTALTYIRQKGGERLLDPAMVTDDERFAAYLERTDTSTRAMRYGTETEPEALRTLAWERDLNILPGGAAMADGHPYIFASPDGRVDGQNLIVEVKCPTAGRFFDFATSVKTGADLAAADIDYYWQVQCQLLCTGADGCYWCAYCPDCKPLLVCVLVQRDSAVIAEMLERAEAADAYIDRLVAEVRGE